MKKIFSRNSMLSCYCVIGSLISAPSFAIGIPAGNNLQGPFTQSANVIAVPVAATPIALPSIPATGVIPGNPAGNPLPLNGGGSGGGGGGAGNDGTLNQVTQSSVRDAVNDGSGGNDNLFSGNTTIPTSGLTAEQLGALAPAAGGGMTGDDEETACLNAYLQSSNYPTKELKDKCSGKGDNT